MLKWLALFAALGLAPAQAQTKFTMPPPAGVFVMGVQVVASCGSAVGLAANNIAYLAMDTTGVLCTSLGGGGSSFTVNYGAANAVKGTPSGFNDGSGNFQPLLGDAVNGQWINLKGMGGTPINSGCVAALNGFSTTIPSTVCGIFGSYVLNTNGNGSAVSASSSPVVIASDQAAVAVKGNVNVTQTDCPSIALTTGGTAQNILTASATLRGFRLMNIDPTAGSGEPIWISFTGTATAGAIGSYPLAAPTAGTFAGAGSFSLEFASGFNGNLSVVAATTGHKISCTKW